MSILKKLAGETAIYGMSTIIGRFLNFLLVPIYTRFFTQSDYGIVTELYSYTVFLMIFLTYGMETGFFRFSQNQDDKPNVYTTIIRTLASSSLFFIALVALFLGPISEGLGYYSQQEYIMWMAIVIGVDAFSTIPFAKLRSQNKALKFATIKLINIGINIGLNVLLIIVFPYLFRTYEYSWIPEFAREPDIAFIFISNLIASCVTLVMLLPEIISPKDHNAFDRVLLKRILSYSWPLLIAGLAGSINEVYDRISLRYFLTVPEGVDASKYILSQVGIYGANYKLAMIIAIFNQAFRFAAEPFFFSRMHAGDARELYAKIMNYFVAFTLLIFLGIMLYLDVFKHFIGSNFHEGLHIVPILLVANIFLGIVFNLSIWYKLSNKTRYGIWIVGFGALITIAINMLFVPTYGYVACAWATLACYVLMAILSYRLCQKHYGIPYNLKKIGTYFLVAGIVYSTDIFVNIDNAIFSYTFKTLSILAFIGIVYRIEKRNINSLLTQK
ncbi:MAG: oligosaccharide flippase family protein [Bacteroidales bacterium]|jgi:O-antigen/teichoic acid export membrane protein|nr:oligosaccharide flippase family protein [Bacteroidales bacterium]